MLLLEVAKLHPDPPAVPPRNFVHLHACTFDLLMQESETVDDLIPRCASLHPARQGSPRADPEGKLIAICMPTRMYLAPSALGYFFPHNFRPPKAVDSRVHRNYIIE